MKTTVVQELENIFRSSFNQLGIVAERSIALQDASKPEFGDFQVNGAMGIAKELRKNPREVASEIIANIPANNMIEKMDIAGPGFINVSLSKQYLEQRLGSGVLLLESPVTHKIVVDYSAPNLAKEMHVGHLRSTIIGDSLVRIFEYLGNEVVRRNHVGDWGTQFGMLTAYLFENQSSNSDVAIELADLEGFYRKAKVRFDEDEEFASKARQFVVRLQSGDEQILALWEKFVNTSLEHCQAIYDLLNTKRTREDVVGESFYNDLLTPMVDRLVASGFAVDSAGAKCIFLTEEDIGTKEETPFIIQKKDGGFLYATTDIAAVYDRVERLHADRLVYVIDSRQSLHMKQLFAVSRKAGIAQANTMLEHAAFGTMMGEDGKPFKTRSGGTIKLIDLITEAKTRAYKMIAERNIEWNESEIKHLADTLAIASIKYADLSKNRLSDYIFSFDKMLAFEGNTAPYLLYAYTRIISIFRKSEVDLAIIDSYKLEIVEAAEHKLALHLTKFADKLAEAARDNYPHYLCSYLYELAGLFMRFYESCPILKDGTAIEVRQSRLRLSNIAAATLKTGLDLLGISVVDKM